MKNRTLLIFSFLLVIHSISAQVTIPVNLKGVATKKISTKITEGSQFEIISFHNKYEPSPGTYTNNINRADILVNGEIETIPYSQLDGFLATPTNVSEFWKNQALINSSYLNILSIGFQYDMRKELEEDALGYLNYLTKNNLLFDDSYLESYLYSLIYKIYPLNIADGRPGTLNIKIIKDYRPNAFVLNNGSIFISTGLLSMLNSEEELTAVLAHEISHFVLDHSIININKANQRKKNAEFWAAFATAAAAVTEGYLMAQNSYYRPGNLTYGTAVLAQSIAKSIEERLGLKYSRDQEMQADKCAVLLLKFISVNPLALSSALKKIKDYSVSIGDYIALSGEGSHPAIDLRIKEIGEPPKFNNVKYDRQISFINTFNAYFELNNQHFNSCINLTKRNIDAGVATEDDYLLMANSFLNLYNSEEKNFEVLNLIGKAKTLNIFPSQYTSKIEAIVLIRLKKLSEAKLCLQKYKEELETSKQNNFKSNNYQQIYSINEFLNNEIEWAIKMTSKVEKL